MDGICARRYHRREVRVCETFFSEGKGSMRLRLLLIAAVTGVAAVIVVPNAGALTFPDDVCPVRTGTVIKVCPSGQTGKAYSYQIRGRDGTGCVPYVTFKADGLPPGLSMGSSSGVISGVPKQAGTYVFWVTMQDIPASQGGVSWCADDASTEKQCSGRARSRSGS
jgi:hypothetical protein